MKRKILLPCLALALTAALAGCSNTASTNSPAPSAPAVAPSDSPAPESGSNPVTRGIDRAMDDIGDAASGIDEMTRNGKVLTPGNGGSADASGWVQPSADR